MDKLSLKNITLIVFLAEILILVVGMVERLFNENRSTSLFDYISILFYSFFGVGVFLLILNVISIFSKKNESILPIVISVIIILLPFIVVALMLVHN